MVHFCASLVFHYLDFLGMEGRSKKSNVFYSIKIYNMFLKLKFLQDTTLTFKKKNARNGDYFYNQSYENFKKLFGTISIIASLMTPIIIFDPREGHVK